MVIIRYYTPPGSYDGLIKVGGVWQRVKGLNRIDKDGWKRWQGPPTLAMERALKSKVMWSADALFPGRARQWRI